MADEFKHKTVGTKLTQPEFEDILLHVFDAQTAGDILYASSVTQLRRLAIGSTDKVLTVVAGVPAWTAASWASISSGNYTGNDTENRAIAHGLGVAPKIILIHDTNREYIFRIVVGFAYVVFTAAGTAGGFAVTAMGATNFYVGDISSYFESANKNAREYYWIAIG